MEYELIRGSAITIQGAAGVRCPVCGGSLEIERIVVDTGWGYAVPLPIGYLCVNRECTRWGLLTRLVEL